MSRLEETKGEGEKKMEIDKLTKEHIALLLEAIGSHHSKVIEFGEGEDVLKKIEELAEILRLYA
jgi:hypothetical protein